MNITIDKTGTLAALERAEGRLFGKDRDLVMVLIDQIKTHGKGTTNAANTN